jgi:manganese/zinc/iron transport system substrate-binding protein
MTHSRRLFLAGLAATPLLARPLWAQETLDVVATTGMIADMAQAIGGAHVNVTALMGPGVDPHAYRQTRSDIIAMTRADLVLWNGLFLEAQLEEFLHKLEKRGAVTAIGDALPKTDLMSHEDYEGRHDPHLWMAPRLWSQAVEAARVALIKARPEAAIEFDKNASAYLAQLDQLDTYANEALSTIPQEARVLITAHDAFGYFGREFGFEVMGIQGLSTASEAGLQRISEMVDTLVSRKIGAVFVESSVSDRNIRALIEGAAAKGHTVTIGGELYSDAMGQPGTYEGTYIGMIDHNVTTITRALGGTAPQRGMMGKLQAES